MSDPDLQHLAAGARLAVRGHGRVEPNPMVGCVITDDGGAIVGWGYHRFFGGPHAEIDALRRAGDRARGGCAYLTLEPCAHAGKTPPCTEALIRAGVRRVVIARRDPNPIAGGGVERLRAAGLEVAVRGDAAAAAAAGAPFARRHETGLPWVLAKWAQTIDGRVATRAGESRWISGERSRQLVHRERGRVDAILTGIGTVRADDPMLTARGVRRRRLARRVVVDPGLDIPPAAALVRTAADAPTSIACAESTLTARRERAQALAGAGIELIGIPGSAAELPMEPLLRALASRHDVTTVLVEAGPGLLGRLFREKLVSEACVFVAPLLLADEKAVPCATGLDASRLADGVRLELIARHERDGDVVLRYLVTGSPPPPADRRRRARTPPA